jgi:hypothetical protein
MKHQVKIFFDILIHRLVEDINEWLTKHSDLTIVNIEYSMSDYMDEYNSIHHCYSALIHYVEGDSTK